jgi:hypothetical protein
MSLAPSESPVRCLHISRICAKIVSSLDMRVLNVLSTREVQICLSIVTGASRAPVNLI